MSSAASGADQDVTDRGSATVWAACALTVLLTVVVLAAHLGAAVVARHRAEGAADAAALGGAVVVLSGSTVACDRAELIARVAGSRLDRCEVSGLDVRVVVSVRSGLLGTRAVGRAHAGPAPPVAPP